eukprot:1536207-Alexandrium_andersonii.AAC.1
MSRGLDAELASVSTRVAITSRLAGLRLASESNLGWVFPDLRVECVLLGGIGLCSAIPVAVWRPTRLASRTCESEPP